MNLANTATPDLIPVAFFGAHMEGLPLNKDLQALNAQFLYTAKTAPIYEFYALAGGPPYRPGIVRVNAPTQGHAIDCEVWGLTAEALGKLIVSIPAPLGIGTITLDNNQQIKGFICEQAGLEGSQNITQWGGWRQYLAHNR